MSDKENCYVNMAKPKGQPDIRSYFLARGQEPRSHVEMHEKDPPALEEASGETTSVPSTAIRQVLKKRRLDPDPRDQEAAYEVEAIVDYQFCQVRNIGLYLVKWTGWDEKYNTWEPLENLISCKEHLDSFYKGRIAEYVSVSDGAKGKMDVPIEALLLYYYTHHGRPPSLKELNALFRPGQLRKEKKWQEKTLLNELKNIVRKKEASNTKKSRIRMQILLREVDIRRERQLQMLSEWQHEMNRVARGSPHIVVINDMDLEGPPTVTYINTCKAGVGVPIHDDPPVYCSCKGGSCTSHPCTCCTEYVACPYTKLGRVRIPVGNPIYECNKQCHCGPDCYRRVVQKGGKLKLCVYRTTNGCGWGVKAMQSIKKGTFVVEYVGEIITTEEAALRESAYAVEEKSYLLDLDFSVDETKYTVDATNYGNVSRFINHSCDPNLAIYNVWIDCLDPYMPHICFFASKDINIGDSITFDYRQQQLPCNTTGNKPIISKCMCRSQNCRKEI